MVQQALKVLLVEHKVMLVPQVLKVPQEMQVLQVPKVLQDLAGRPLLAHVLDTAAALDPARIHVVYGHGGDQVRAAFAERPVSWVEQAEQKGTGHAVDVAMPQIPDGATVLVLYGDVPLIGTSTLRELLQAAAEGLAILTVELDDPSGYGRILRDPEGAVRGIVEQKDASAEQLAIREANTGILAAPAAQLRGWLEGLDNDNAQGEYYLTDCVAASELASGTTGSAARYTAEAVSCDERACSTVGWRSVCAFCTACFASSSRGSPAFASHTKTTTALPSSVPSISSVHTGCS